MRRYLAIVLRLLLGGVLLYAAYAKIRDPWERFAMSIAAYGLLPEWAVLVAARTLPWLEAVLGVLVIRGYALRYTSLAITGLLGTFFAVMLFSFARGLGIDCGCFGPGETLGPRTLLRDGVLLAASTLLTVYASAPAPRARQTPRGSSPAPLRRLSDEETTNN